MNSVLRKWIIPFLIICILYPLVLATPHPIQNSCVRLRLQIESQIFSLSKGRQKNRKSTRDRLKAAPKVFSSVRDPDQTKIGNFHLKEILTSLLIEMIEK